MAHGFGYPLFLFSYHLPWVLGTPVYKITESVPFTIKSLFVISYVASGFFMYQFGWELFKNRVASLLATILYLWAPYRFVTILVSASVGTAFVFTFLPLLLWGILKTARDNSRFARATVALSLSCIILSHAMTVPFIWPLVLLFALFIIRKNPKSAWSVSWSITLGIALAAFYLLPALYYSRFTQIATGAFAHIYQQNFVNLHQLVYSKWGYGIAQNAKDGAFSYQVGIAQWLAFAAFIGILFSKRMTSLSKTLAWCFTFVLLGSIFAMLEFSRPIWDALTGFITLDYPTGFLLPAVFSGSILAGFAHSSLSSRNWQTLFFIPMVVIVLYTNRNHLRVNEYTNFPTSLYVESEPTTNSYDEYLPKGVNLPQTGAQANFIAHPDVKVFNVKQNTKELSFLADIPQDAQISVRQFAFPGVNLYVDGTPARYDKDSLGRVRFAARAGEHNIEVRFEETPLMVFSKFVSLTALTLIALTFFIKNEKKT